MNHVLPVRLVLAAQDEHYIEPFLHYLRCSEFDRHLIVTAFSGIETFVQFLEESADTVDAVLGDPAFIEAAEGRIQGIPLICLTEGNQGANSELQISKFQPLHLLLSSLLDLIRGGGREGNSPIEGRAAVIGVTSTVGGCGKTTVALNLARQLAAEGGKVFYLNLETVQGGILLDGQGNQGEGQRVGLARLLYELKAAEDRQEPPKFPVSTYAYRNPLLQGDTFGPLDNLNELLEMERKDTAELIDYIAGSGLYDTVIVDTDSFPNGRTEAVLEQADQLIWLVTNDWSVMRKTGVWLAHLERSRPSLFNGIISKTLFTANRVQVDLSIPLPGKGMVVEAALSYIADWNQGSRQGTLLHSPVFQRDMMKLCRKLSDRGQETGANGGTPR